MTTFVTSLKSGRKGRYMDRQKRRQKKRKGLQSTELLKTERKVFEILFLRDERERSKKKGFCFFFL